MRDDLTHNDLINDARLAYEISEVSSIASNNNQSISTTAIVSLCRGIDTIPLDKIVPNPYQPRREFALEELTDLAQSISKVGLLQPPVVRHKGTENVYELVAGERRVRACRLLGLQEIPVYVCDPEASSDAWQAESALIENIQRVDLNPIDTAIAIERLMSLEGSTQEEVAEKVGKKRSTISNYLRLLKLPGEIQEHIRKGRISFAHAKVLLSCPDARSLGALIRNMLDKNWPVKRCEEYVRSYILAEAADLRPLFKQKPKDRDQGDLFYEEIMRNMESLFGTKVELIPKGKSGAVIIHYSSVDQLNMLLQRWGVSID